jgi:Arc/MetJ family transcription regulator
MTKMLVDIDDEALNQAAKVFGTKTIEDTVNAALRQAARRSERVEALKCLGEMADRGDFDEFVGTKAAYRRTP